MDRKLTDAKFAKLKDKKETQKVLNTYLFLLHQYHCIYREIGQAFQPQIAIIFNDFKAKHFSHIEDSSVFACYYALQCCIYKDLQSSSMFQALKEFYENTLESKISNTFLRNDFAWMISKLFIDFPLADKSWEVEVKSFSDGILVFYQSRNKINNQIATDSCPEIMQILHFVDNFKNQMFDFKKWFTENLIVASSQTDKIEMLQNRIPNSRCLSANSDGKDNSFFFCFAKESMIVAQVNDDDSFHLFNCPSFDLKYPLRFKNSYLQHFTKSLLLYDSKESHYLFDYRQNCIVLHYDAKSLDFTEFQEVKSWPMLKPFNFYHYQSNMYDIRSCKVHSIIAQDKKSNVVEIFPQFILDDGYFLFINYSASAPKPIFRFLNLDQFKKAEIRFDSQIWLLRFDCTQNFFGSQFDQSSYLSSPISVFQVSEIESGGTAVLLFNAAERKDELYIIARYLDSHLYKHAFLKLISIHLVYEFDRCEINIIKACLRYIESCAPMTVEKRIVKFYLTYLLYRCMISFGTPNLATMYPNDNLSNENPPEFLSLDELKCIWPLIPLYARASLYQARAFLTAITKKNFWIPQGFSDRHQVEIPKEDKNFDAYGKDIIAKCKIQGYIPRYELDFASDYPKLAGYQDRFLSFILQSHGRK